MTAINLQMFGTPKAVYQSSNINQLSPKLGSIAYQVNDSLLAGKGVSLIYSLNNTVALNYVITGNQSDKLSSDHSVNILAQCSAKSFARQLAKTLADVSAKIYANQSGEYFLGQSAKHFANLKRGEFTPFAKGDFSHLSKEANYLHWQDLIVVTTRGGIEFCESIKGKIIEFCQSIKKERIEFLESIKKGSQSATLGNVDIKYRASENINISLLLWYGKYQPFGSKPRDCNSFLMMRLIQADIDSSPSASIAFLIDSSNCGSTLKAICLLPLGNFVFDMCNTQSVCCLCQTVYNTFGSDVKQRSPEVRSTLSRLLITNDSLIIEVTMSKHNTPVTGRTSLTPNQSYRWLFLALNRSDYTAKPCRIAVTAPNENSARLMLVRDYMLIFAGRLPAIGGKHHA